MVFLCSFSELSEIFYIKKNISCSFLSTNTPCRNWSALRSANVEVPCDSFLFRFGETARLFWLLYRTMGKLCFMLHLSCRLVLSRLRDD